MAADWSAPGGRRVPTEPSGIQLDSSRPDDCLSDFPTLTADAVERRSGSRRRRPVRTGIVVADPGGHAFQLLVDAQGIRLDAAYDDATGRSEFAWNALDRRSGAPDPKRAAPAGPAGAPCARLPRYPTPYRILLDGTENAGNRLRGSRARLDRDPVHC